MPPFAATLARRDRRGNPVRELEEPIHLFILKHILKWGYPLVIHFKRIFHYKPPTLGYPHEWKPPYDHLSYIHPHSAKPNFQCNFVRQDGNSVRTAVQRARFQKCPLLAAFGPHNLDIPNWFAYIHACTHDNI